MLNNFHALYQFRLIDAVSVILFDVSPIQGLKNCESLN